MPLSWKLLVDTRGGSGSTELRFAYAPLAQQLHFLPPVSHFGWKHRSYKWRVSSQDLEFQEIRQEIPHAPVLYRNSHLGHLVLRIWPDLHHQHVCWKRDDWVQRRQRPSHQRPVEPALGRRRGCRRQRVHRRHRQQPHPQGREWGDLHRGGKRDARVQRRRRPGHQRPVVVACGRRGGFGRQPVCRRPEQQPHPQGLKWGDHHRGGKRHARLQRRQRPCH
jgi:hypothetical protein